MTQRRPIISARRTDTLEDLLQKLWALRPEYKEKQAFTITAGVAALIREIERTEFVIADHRSPLAHSVIAETTKQPTAAVTATNTAFSTISPMEKRRAQVSDDVDWE